jgi:exosortase
VLLIAIGLIWLKRDRLGPWTAENRTGLAMLVFSTFCFLAAMWADIDFLKPIAATAIGLCAAWYVAGPSVARVLAGPLGLLLFVVPWPTTLVARLAFPLQLVSSAYAGQLAGMLGLPIVRDGVNLAVMPDLHRAPVYEVVVAQECSGLTSIIVLLTIGYLIAYLTPIRTYLRAILLVSVIPLALILNAVRLTAILCIGTWYSHSLAMWVHNHEEPVLVFFTTLCVIGIRRYLIDVDSRLAGDVIGGAEQ